MLVMVGYAEEAGARTEQSEEAEVKAIQSNGLSVMMLVTFAKTAELVTAGAFKRASKFILLRRLQRARVLRSCIAA